MAVYLMGPSAIFYIAIWLEYISYGKRDHELYETYNMHIFVQNSLRISCHPRALCSGEGGDVRTLHVRNLIVVPHGSGKSLI